MRMSVDYNGSGLMLPQGLIEFETMFISLPRFRILQVAYMLGYDDLPRIQ